ncbi:alpha-L-fucosidase [Nonomuraea sp. CA-141351]|uniref:alpha-L-fucosidase n=1 Tax=Nonomuraea sp. CA-141351 TaxID=3239996 RepID=UPI003D907295
MNSLSAFAELRFGMFLHFNMGTFTDEEWAAPHQDPKLFAPTAVDCEQWAAAAVAAKMSYGVLTAKHHDGFCLWPSAHTDYASRDDIVERYVSAFRAAGLKVGLYFSIWDRTAGVQAPPRFGVAADQAVRPHHVTFVLDQLTELLTRYGPIDLLVTDGYAWQMGQRAVPYQRIRETVRALQPGIVMIDHAGLLEPFVGDAIYFEEPLGITAPPGNTYAGVQGQTISDGWFWHPSTPTEQLMSKADILHHLADLEPKYVSFLLNCPPNRDGVLDGNIVARLAEVAESWPGPDLSRPPLPPQPPRVEYPVTPAGAYASAGQDADNAIDGLCAQDHESSWSAGELPQSLTVDLGELWSGISALEYLPRQLERDADDNGDVTACTISTSVDGLTFAPVATAAWAADRTMKFARWPAVDARYVRIEVAAAAGGYAFIGNLRIGGEATLPTRKGRK